MPDSASVGTFGNSAMRLAVVTASIFMLLLRTKPITELTVSVMNSICPPTRSTSAGALPLYGTCVASRPLVCTNWKAARWVTLPLPAEPYDSLPGWALA